MVAGGRPAAKNPDAKYSGASLPPPRAHTLASSGAFAAGTAGGCGRLFVVFSTALMSGGGGTGRCGRCRLELGADAADANSLVCGLSFFRLCVSASGFCLFSRFLPALGGPWATRKAGSASPCGLVSTRGRGRTARVVNNACTVKPLERMPRKRRTCPGLPRGVRYCGWIILYNGDHDQQ